MDNFENITLKGTFSFFSNGELIAEKSNAFTVSGRSIAIRSLLGHIPNFVDSIAVGIGASANTLNSTATLIQNNTLDFEVRRSPIIGSTLEITSTGKDALIYYTTLADSDVYEIREVGLFPSKTPNESSFLSGEVLINFDGRSFIENGSYSPTASVGDSSSARIGLTMLSIPGNGSLAANNIEIRQEAGGPFSVIDSYVSSDTFRLAGVNDSINLTTCSIVFQTNATNYFVVPFIFPASSKYYVAKTTKGSAVVAGDPSWSSITGVKIFSDYPLLLDALKIDIGPSIIDTTFGMISRAVVPSGIQKSETPLTIQYSLLVDFQGGT